MNVKHLKQIVIGSLISLTIFSVGICILIVFDLHLHTRFDNRGGLNYRGYRGPVIGKKKKDEVRIGFFGGSVAMGYGVVNKHSIAGQLQQLVNENSGKVKGVPKYTVINLAATGEANPAYFKAAYNKFDYLDLDTAILYLWGNPESSPFSILLSEESIKDWDTFIRRIKVSEREIDKRVWTLLDEGVRHELRQNFKPEMREKKAIINTLNRFIEDRNAFVKEELDGVLAKVMGHSLDIDYSALSNAESRCLNRLYFESYYPEELYKIEDIFLQKRYCTRTENRILRYFNYYFIFPTVLREKYYLLRYGNISKGYLEDKFFGRIVDFAFSARPEAMRAEKREKSDTLHRFVDQLTDRGKMLILALAPSELCRDTHYWDDLKAYLKFRFYDNPMVVVVDLKGTFSPEEPSFYLLDGLHYNEEGNHAIARALYKYIPLRGKDT